MIYTSPHASGRGNSEQRAVLLVELPHAEGPAFAWLDSSNQHDLHYHNQTEISLEEISDAALQYGHVLGWTPAQSLADP